MNELKKVNVKKVYISSPKHIQKELQRGISFVSSQIRVADPRLKGAPINPLAAYQTAVCWSFSNPVTFHLPQTDNSTMKNQWLQLYLSVYSYNNIMFEIVTLLHKGLSNMSHVGCIAKLNFWFNYLIHVQLQIKIKSNIFVLKYLIF